MFFSTNSSSSDKVVIEWVSPEAFDAFDDALDDALDDDTEVDDFDEVSTNSESSDELSASLSPKLEYSNDCKVERGL